MAAIAMGNQRRQLNLTAISATLLPAVWLTQLLGIFVLVQHVERRPLLFVRK
jgi:hypothetical protein